MPPETDPLLSFLEKFLGSQATQNHYEEALKLLKEINLESIKNSIIIPLLWKARNGNKADGLEENLKTLIDTATDFSADGQTLLKLNRIYEIVKEENIRYVTVDNFIQSSTEELRGKQKQLGEDLEKLQSLEATFKQKESDLQKQYITILGIFASIVLTLVAGFVFSTSVLSNMHEVSIYRLAFAISCIAFLLFNLIYVLSDFILKISGGEGDRNWWEKINKILLSMIAIFLLICFACDETKSKTPSSTANNSFIYLQSQQQADTLKCFPNSKNERENTKQIHNRDLKQINKRKQC